MENTQKWSPTDLNAPHELLAQLRAWALELGFSQIGVADIDLSQAETSMLSWLAQGFHGEMTYMARHGTKRSRPAELVAGTVRIITARMNYLPKSTSNTNPTNLSSKNDWQAIEWQRLSNPQQATVSLYARGRDYHKVMRSRLQKLAEKLSAVVGPLGFRVFTDSAPVLEVELAAKSGLGWRGKHTLALSREVGSMFFLGEIYINLPLPTTEPVSTHCGSCSACIEICPTRAILGPHTLDARRCISYLTIEASGPIPRELRSLIGNRIYGCDDCQLICPWNKYAQRSNLPDFDVREPLNNPSLLTLWGWTEMSFLRNTEGSAIRRIGFERWQRNLAVALGNALRSVQPAEDHLVMRNALRQRHPTASALVREHIEWALESVA
jgi:epoxyqueuosine reductase